MKNNPKKGKALADSVVVATPSGHSRDISRLSKILAVAVVAIVVLAGAWGIYRIIRGHGSNRPPAQPALTPLQHIHELSNSGSYDDAQKLIAQQAAASKSPEDKAGWYTQAYTTAVNAHKYDDALTYAMKAYQTTPNSATADGVAQVYELLNDNTNARKYLQIAIDKLDKSSPGYQLTLKQYQTEMDGLGKS